MLLLLLVLVLGTTLALTMALADVLAAAARRREMSALVTYGDTGSSLAGLRRRLDRRLQRTRPGAWTQVAIEESGLRTTRLIDVLLVAGGATVLVCLVVGLVLTPLLVPVVLLAVVPGAILLVRRQQDRRRERFIGQMPQLARVLSNAAQAGLSLRTAVEIAAEELSEPAGAEMARVANALSVGESLERALEQLELRLPSREVVVLTSTMIVSSRAGGSLISSLRKVADTLEERKQTRREVRTLLSQARATAVLIPIIGLASLLLINSIGENTLDTMLRQPVGQLLSLITLAMYAFGGYLFSRVTRVDA